MWADLPEGPFDVIAADPPWAYRNYSDKGNGRSAEQHYRTAPLETIASLPVRDVVASSAHCFLWITGPLLAQGAHNVVLPAWGFQPTAIGMVWVKKNWNAEEKLWERWRRTGTLVIDPSCFFMSTGKTTRQNAEFVVLGRRGKPTRHSTTVHQILTDPRREHSRKPDSFFESVERYVSPTARKLELFSRQERPGWTVWGNETTKFRGKADGR